jgi:hypothetical protein
MKTKICPEQEALPGIGGLYNCEQDETRVQIMQHSKLEDRPQFASVIADPLDITPDDYLAFLLGDFQTRGYTNIKLVNSTDLTINVTSKENPRVQFLFDSCFKTGTRSSDPERMKTSADSSSSEPPR